MTLEELNWAPEGEAARSLRACCGSSKWVEEMIARRPFASNDDLLLASNSVWAETDRDDWLEAFSHHPRIGDRPPSQLQEEVAARWSSSEQASLSSASTTVQQQLDEVNRAYEERFGHFYIVCATGKSAEEMLDSANARMTNDPDVEIRIAAEEQRKITQLRLLKLVGGAT